MASLLFPDDPDPQQSLLGVPPATDDLTSALGSLYHRVVQGQPTTDPTPFPYADNPVGTERLHPDTLTPRTAWQDVGDAALRGLSDPRELAKLGVGLNPAANIALSAPDVAQGGGDIVKHLLKGDIHGTQPGSLQMGLGLLGMVPFVGSVAREARGPLSEAARTARGILGEIPEVAAHGPGSAPRLNSDAVGFADRISTRQPSLADDVHATANYTVDRPSFDDAVAAPKSKIGSRVDEVLSRHVGLNNASVDGLTAHIADNLKALYNAVPETWRNSAANWYNGARSLAENMAETYGTSVRAQAANLAALSPQRRWEHNVEGSMRVANIHANHADSGWTPALEGAWHGTEEAPSFATLNPGWQDIYANIQGKTLSEISDPKEAALWVRLHDRAHAEHNNVRIVNPDGTRGGFLLNDAEEEGAAGLPATLQWGTLDAVGNALSSLRDDSMANISANMGGAHKVRNFYNNIVSPDAGHDVTIDTHAVAAGLLRPLGSSSPEVSYGLGSSVNKKYRPPAVSGDDVWPSTMAHAGEGLQGMYALYADAYRRAADELGILPRQLQSVTWEGIRGLYNGVERRDKGTIANNLAIWKAVNNGYVDPQTARAGILGKGIRAPNWAEP